MTTALSRSLAFLTLTLSAPAAQDFEVEAQPLSWSELPTVFDRSWTLPERPRESRDLLGEMRRLAELRFEIDLGEGPEERTLGDLVAMSRELDAGARVAWLDDLPRFAPRLMADWGEGLRELLLEDELFSSDWDPTKDRARDGLLTADDWLLSSSHGSPWSELKSPRFAQAAALFVADLPAIKAAENDYRAYPDNPGSQYEEINPERGGHFRGTAPDGNPFSTLSIQFRCDLPFPFSGYDCRLGILNRIDSDGLVRTDIYSTSSDFYYLAGRDVFLPVRSSSGRQLAFLVVRHFGFDLRRVPDKPRHRSEGVRSSLGNLKRNAERRFRDRGEAFTPSPEAIGNLRVLGRD